MLPRDATPDDAARPGSTGSADPFGADEGFGPDGGDVEPVVPAVVAVVVAHDAGPWLEECLASLRDQDYDGLSVLVIDAASEADPTPRVAQEMPSAYVRRVDVNAGFGAAANEVLEVVQGAAFFLFCHDDVAPAPDAVRTMVEEAFRSNAGIVAPKLVRWDDPARILQVGLTADKTGYPAALAERGELDQEQHDAVRDVFVAPGGCTLVRADLFRAIGGFDPGIFVLGDDLDLCWRAQVAGARVVVAPAATVRHLEALGTRTDADFRRRLQARHRLRTMLTCYSPFHLVRVVPQAFLLMVVEVVYSLLAGRVVQAREVAGAWRWNLLHRREIRSNRAHLRAVRQLPDSEVRRLQVRGSARLTAVVRGQIGGHGDDRLKSVTDASLELAGSLRSGPRRTELIVWAAIVGVLVVGSRGLFFGHVPGFADLPSFPSRPWTLWGEWFNGWRSSGVGREGAQPLALAVLGALGTVTLLSLSLLRRLLLLVPLGVGAVGAWRLLRDTGSRRAQLVAAGAFMAIPVPYNAIGRGRLGGLLLWAAAPWLLRTFARLAGHRPFDADTDGWGRTAVRLGLAVALLAAVAPFAPVAVLVLAVGVALGGLVVGEIGGVGRVVGAAVAAVGVAFVLHLPGSLDLLQPGAQWTAIGGVRSTGLDLSIADLLRFQSGPIGASFLAYGFAVAALLPLVIGRDWRFRWALRAWIVALTCWATAWLGQQPWFHWGLGPPEALLGPAAAALALAVALGLVAFEVDLRGYRFGWRQGASVAAAGALVVGVLPLVAGLDDGRWGMPDRGPDAVLGFLHDEQASGAFRVLWIGDPDVLPAAGWTLSDGVAYATTDQGLARVVDRYPGSADATTQLIADAVRSADRRDTARLGRLLAPMAIRYVVVADAAAPFVDDRRPVPDDVRSTLDGQIDLQEVPVDPLFHVYRNTAWAAERAALPVSAVAGATAATDTPGYLERAASTDVSGSTPVLLDDAGRTNAKGPLGDDATVLVSAPASSSWHLRVGGTSLPRTTAFGWAMAFTGAAAGQASLTYTTPLWRYALCGAQLALWAGAIWLLWSWRRRRTARPAGPGGET